MSKIPASKFGWIQDKYDHRDYKFQASPRIVVKLPAYVNLRDKCPGVYDQSALGSCVAQSVAGAMEFNEIKQQKKEIFTPSRLFIYYNARVMIGTEDEDSGAQIRDGIKSVVNDGACPEPLWPYHIEDFAIKPSEDCYNEALKFQAIKYERINYDLTQMKACLAEGFPFVYGINVYNNFPMDTKTGNIPMPPWLFARTIGGHAMVAVGYDDAKKVFIVRNSWGEEWGNKGYGTIPYKYLTNPRYASDFWVIKLVE